MNLDDAIFNSTAGEDYEVVNEDAAFLSGSSNGSVCVVIQSLTDNVVENSEVYSVTFSSNDDAVIINENANTVVVTIIDSSEGNQPIIGALIIIS